VSHVDNDLILSCIGSAISETRPEEPRKALTEALEIIFAMAYSSYSLGSDIDEFVEVNGKWMRYPAGHG
jgi:hypothetical protein